MQSLMGETTGHINAWGDPRRATAPPQDRAASLLKELSFPTPLG